MKPKYEFAAKKLETIRRLIWKYEYLLNETETAKIKEISESCFAELTLDHFVDVDLVVRLYGDLTNMVTIARVDEIRLKVEKQSWYWVNKYGEEFSKAEADKRTQKWLYGAVSGEYKDVKGWIDEGWCLLKGELSAPWGRCKECNTSVLRPKQVGKDRVWVVFDKCDQCYMSQKSLETERLQATRGHKVAKPGSAAKRGQGRKVNENVRPMDRKKGKAK